MLNYVRKHIDGKLISVDEPEAVTERSNDMIYHADPKKPDDEELGFNTIAGYNAFPAGKRAVARGSSPYHNHWYDGRTGRPYPETGGNGNVVYPVRNMKGFIGRHQIDSVFPSTVINMAHGRMGDYIVDYLAQQNIPLFTPLNVNRLVEEWENDKMGMSGGFLSQSVVTPEIDGGYPSFRFVRTL